MRSPDICPNIKLFKNWKQLSELAINVTSDKYHLFCEVPIRSHTGDSTRRCHFWPLAASHNVVSRWLATESLKCSWELMLGMSSESEPLIRNYKAIFEITYLVAVKKCFWGDLIFIVWNCSNHPSVLKPCSIPANRQSTKPDARRLVTVRYG